MQERNIVLTGEQVALVEMMKEDQPFFQKWHAESEELRTLIDDHSVPTMDDQLRWFERSKQPDRCMFSIVLSGSNELIGHGGFVDIDAHKRMAQLRITIGNPAYWGRGLGTEATGLLVEYGFSKLQLTSIWLRVLPSNTRAIRSYEKVGFLKGEREIFHDTEVVRMQIFKDDFR